MRKYAYVLSLLLLSLSPSVFADYIKVSGKVALLQTWEGHSGLLVRLEDRIATVGACSRNDW